MKLVTLLQKFRTFHTQLEQEAEEKKKDSTDFDFLWKAYSPIIIPEKPDPLPEQYSIRITPGARLINLSKHEGLLNQWFDNRLSELRRIYRGSEHHFTRASFDKYCVKKGPTLSVIQSENGRIFGGYTSKDWMNTVK